VKVVAVIDGEHYPQVVRAALAELEHEVVGAYFAGGTEKIAGGEDYGVPLADDFEAALERFRPELVVDLSDEPVLSPRERLLLASRALAKGIPYAGPDFRFEPPQYTPFPLPSVAVIGTGKRVGKTAVTGHVARVLARERKVVVVAMGRGGPPEPEVVSSPPTLDDLLARSRAGDHAASDYLETAALAGVTTVGCRRCGGGLAGKVATSNVADGAAVAASLDPDLVVFDGSGAAVPPVQTDLRIVVAHDVESGLNPYRVLSSDLVLTMDESVGEQAELLTESPVFHFDLRLRPAAPLHGRRAAVFTTGPALLDDLDAEVVHVSRNLARRADLEAELVSVDADVYVVELKAAAIDVVARAAVERGAEVVLARNDVVCQALDEALLAYLPGSKKEPALR
jgi:cyclic 2,3-diphosphoglycerate synthase